MNTAVTVISVGGGSDANDNYSFKGYSCAVHNVQPQNAGGTGGTGQLGNGMTMDQQSAVNSNRAKYRCDSRLATGELITVVQYIMER